MEATNSRCDGCANGNHGTCNGLFDFGIRRLRCCCACAPDPAQHGDGDLRAAYKAGYNKARLDAAYRDGGAE